MHAQTSFVRNLGDLTRARRRTGPVHEGRSYKMNMHAGEKSDEVIRAEKRPNKGACPQRRLWSKGPRPRETAAGRPRPGTLSLVERAGGSAPSGATK